MLAAAPAAAPALNTRTRTSPRAFAPPPLAVVEGVDVAAPPPDCGVVAGVVLLVLPDDPLLPLVSPDGPLSITCSRTMPRRSEEHTSELQSRGHLVCRLLLEKKKRSSDLFSMCVRKIRGCCY